MNTPAPLGWWSISGEAFLESLRRAANGEDPDLIYAEEYANADIERIEPKERICTTLHGIVTVEQHFAETVIAGTDSLTCIAKAVANAGRVITEGHGETWPKSSTEQLEDNE